MVDERVVNRQRTHKVIYAGLAFGALVVGGGISKKLNDDKAQLQAAFNRAQAQYQHANDTVCMAVWQQVTLAMMDDIQNYDGLLDLNIRPSQTKWSLVGAWRNQNDPSAIKCTAATDIPAPNVLGQQTLSFLVDPATGKFMGFMPFR